jgi:hypothetical protein
MKLSIIIVSYNVKNLVLCCLNSVLSAVANIDSEVFLVDNASVDGTVEEVQKRFSTVYIIPNSWNVGFPKANNQALVVSSGEIMLLLNPDTVLQKDALSELVHFFRVHTGGAVVGMNVRNRDGTRQFSSHGIPSIKSLLFSKYRYRNRNKSVNEPIQITRVGYVSGAALAFNRTVLKHLGGLDEDLFWMEDVDFCYRANKSGFPIYFLPNAVVTHFIGESAKTNIRRVLFHQHVSRVMFFKKHYSRVVTRFIEILIFAELCGKILIRSSQWLIPSQRLESYNRLCGYIAALWFIARRRYPVWA